VGQYERLIMMAEDELIQYSSDARKIEKLRRKVGLSVSKVEQQQVREQLATEIPTDPIRKVIFEQRQAAALPFWGIAGLGLLIGISAAQPVDLIATVVGGGIAIFIQRWGHKQLAKRLVLQTLEEINYNAQTPASGETKSADGKG
jgi:hypothetical protein